MGQSDTVGDKELWEWVGRQDRYVIDQFALAVFGVGALFFAYGQVRTPDLKLLIALIGLGASLTLWMHIYGAQEEFHAIFMELRNNRKGRHKDFFASWKRAMEWRKRGLSRWLYFPVKRMMMYFMALVSWAWVTIIIYRLTRTYELVKIAAMPCVLLASIAVLGLITMLSVYRKQVTDPKKWEQPETSSPEIAEPNMQSVLPT